VGHDADASVTADLVSQLQYPVVLKPQDGSGSQNTCQVDDADTLRLLLDDARGRGEDMLVEEVLAEARPRGAQRFADVLMVDSFVTGGRITHYVVAGHFIPAPPFRGTGSFIPSDLDDGDTKAVLEATEAAIVALGVEEGFTNTDVILTPDGPRVLEVNGRIGGQIPTLLQMAGAPALLPEAMRVALRRSDGDIVPVQTDQVPFCAMYQSPMEARCLLELDGLDVVAQLPGMTQVVANRRAGDSIDWRQGTLSRLFTAYGMADDHDHLYHLYQQIQTSVVARYEMAAPSP
jgi:biotin carboxylase